MFKETLEIAGAADPAALGRECFPYSLAIGERWYAARTLPNRDNFAGQNLQRMGFRVYAPKFWRTVRHARKIQNVLAPLFPGYLFVIVDLSRDRWRSINGTAGVASLIMNADLPMCVPHGVVEAIIDRGHFAHAENCAQTHRVGQKVKILSGPFAETVCQLERLDHNGRVRVLLEIMGGKVAVQLDTSVLCAAE